MGFMKLGDGQLRRSGKGWLEIVTAGNARGRGVCVNVKASRHL